MPEAIEHEGKSYWMGFHAKDGWYFRRSANGDVEIFVTETPHHESPIARSVVIDASSWASIVASVCARGEDGATFREALLFHGSEPVR
jgi:hypothetical protein